MITSRELCIYSVAADDRKLSEKQHLSFPADNEPLLRNVTFLKWSNTKIPSQNQDQIANRDENALTSWLLVSDGLRIVVVEVPLHAQYERLEITAEFEIGSEFGRPTFIDFVLDHHHIIVLYETNIHASVISLQSPHRFDIPKPKFSDHRGLVYSSDKRSLALLGRSGGKDVITVLTRGESDIMKTYHIHPSTHDAQGLAWSPDGKPIIAIWDSSTYGVKAVFSSALGHSFPVLDFDRTTLKQRYDEWRRFGLDIPNGIEDEMGSEAMGITCTVWCSNRRGREGTTIFGIGDAYGTVWLRLQDQTVRALVAPGVLLTRTDCCRYDVLKTPQHHQWR